MKTPTKIALAIFLLIAGILGVVAIKQYQFHQEMVNIVKSDEVKKIIEDDLKQMDPNALTNKGIIKSYEIDFGTVEYNPMGGIMFNVEINGDPKLYGMFGIDKDSDTGLLRNMGTDLSSALSELLR